MKDKIRFILKSEIILKKGVFCPFCNQYQVKLLDKKQLYSIYVCWNENCSHKGTNFIGLNKEISFEEGNGFICSICNSKLIKEFYISNNSIHLSFKCDKSTCRNNSISFIYNLSNNKWEGNSPEISYFREKKSKFENIYDLVLYLLKRERRALTSIEIFRISYRERLFTQNKEITWLMIDKLIKDNIKQSNGKNHIVEIKQGVYDLRERFQSKKVEDPFDQIKEEYDWAFFTPNSRILFQNEILLTKTHVNYLIPELSAYIRSLDIDEKRDFLNSDGFKWRRKLGILNLNSNEKKERFFNNLKRENPNQNIVFGEIELEFDLDKNFMRVNKKNSLFNRLDKVRFKIFKFSNNDGLE